MLSLLLLLVGWKFSWTPSVTVGDLACPLVPRKISGEKKKKKNVAELHLL